MLFGLGIRRKEATESRWEYIDWKERSISLPTEITKTRKPRKIGLGTRLYQELLVRKKPQGYILPRFSPRTITRAITAHLRECGIRARLHDVRHTYTTMLQDLGVVPHQAMKRTGHSDHADLKEVYENRFGFLQENGPVAATAKKTKIKENKR